MDQVLGQMPSQQMSTLPPLPTSPASPMPPTSPPPTPPSKGSYPRFFKIYLFILVFLILALAGFILVLNRYGKFWERKPTPIPTSQKKPTPISVPLEVSARNAFINLLPKILQPSLIPSTTDMLFTQDKIVKESFNISWNTKEGTGGATLTLSSNGKEISSLNLSFLKTQTASPSVTLAQTIIPQFFSIEPKGTWKCSSLYDTTYCENFWEEENGVRRGLSINGIHSFKNGQKGLVLSFCEHGKDASTLYSWKSCTTEFAKTGLK